MIKEVIDYTNISIIDLNLFKEVQGLCEYLYLPKVSAESEGETMKFPSFYQGKDSLRFVTSFDFRNGCLFHLKSGDTEIEQLESSRANKTLLKYTTPMKCYAIHRRNVISDSEDAGEQLALNVANAIQDTDINSLRTALNVVDIDVNVLSYNTSIEQLDEVFENVDIPRRSDITIVCIDYKIAIEGYNECFINYTC